MAHGRSAVVERALRLYLDQVRRRETDLAYERAYGGGVDGTDGPRSSAAPFAVSIQRASAERVRARRTTAGPTRQAGSNTHFTQFTAIGRVGHIPLIP